MGSAISLDEANLQELDSRCLKNILHIKIKENKAKALDNARAVVLGELSMSPWDVYHSAGYRCSLLRQERLSLDLNEYLQQWFGRMDVLHSGLKVQVGAQHARLLFCLPKPPK